MITDDSSQPTPPPQKRIKSVELYKKQHGLTDDHMMVRDHMSTSIQQHALRRERDKSKESRERDRSVEMKESLLSQALEGGPTLTIPPQVRFSLSFFLVYVKCHVKICVSVITILSDCLFLSLF
jgi:hypothetical protein